MVIPVEGHSTDVEPFPCAISTVVEQVQTIFREDPAAKKRYRDFALLSRFHAIILHRLAHRFYRGALLYLLARLVSQFSRWITGIEIHPGAKIGRRFFIDSRHGSRNRRNSRKIGDDVLLYQGVTLGGTGKDKGKRHPTIGNNVVVGGGAKVLGNITIGDCVKVGAGSVVVHSVPNNSTVVGVPGRIVSAKNANVVSALEHGKLPDPEGQAMDDLSKRIVELEALVQHMVDLRTVEQP